MKTLSNLLILLLLSFGQLSKAQSPADFKKIEVSRYSFKPTKEFKLLTVPASFGSSQLTNASLLDSLKNKKVASVRLVYTKYRESETFDQQQLNKKRVANLVATNPTVFSNAGIKWYCVEQTMEDSLQAKTLFHGFYILYSNEAPERNYAMADKLFNTKALEQQSFTITNIKETIVTGKEGTQVTIPANCFVDENQKPYKGEVKLELKEAVTMESIILGNMVTLADGNALESGGMIYIDAKTKDGKKLSLKNGKSLEVNVPAKEAQTGMKVWEAENNGKFMNWKNPKDLMVNTGNSSLKVNLEKEDRISPAKDSVGLIIDFLINSQIENTMMAKSIKNSNDPKFLESVICITVNQKMAYYYTLFQDDKINIILYKYGNYQYQNMILDTTYNIKNFENKPLDLPIPYYKGAEGSLRIRYKNNRLDYMGKIMNDFTAHRDFLYKFNFSKIGSWANIDRLAIDPRTKPVHFFAALDEDIKNYNDICIYLVFKDRKIFIPGYKSEKNKGYGFSHGDSEVPRLPIGAKATVLCIAYKNGTPYYALQNITIIEKQEVVLKPVASSDEAIKKLIADAF